jgi:hypothetical protein
MGLFFENPMIPQHLGGNSHCLQQLSEPSGRKAANRGGEYRIIQGIQRGLWKWSVETETGTKSGTSDSKDAAMTAAKRAIDNALDPKKRKH